MICHIWSTPRHGGGGGGNFHYKGIYRCAAGMGYIFQVSQYMNGYHFYIKSISMGYLFHPKSIWMGKIWKIVYEWGQFSKIVYEWGSIFDMESIWMGHVFHLAWYMNGVGFGDSSRTSVPKIMASYPPPPVPLEHKKRHLRIKNSDNEC